MEMSQSLVGLNPQVGQKCVNCPRKVEKGKQKLFYSLGRGGSESNTICYECRAAQDQEICTLQPEDLLAKLCEKYQVQGKPLDGYCEQHGGCEKQLWDLQLEKLVCVQCLTLDQGGLVLPNDRYIFGHQQVENLEEMLYQQISEMDQAIAHYEREAEKVSAMQQQVKAHEAECVADLEALGGAKGQKALDQYFDEKMKLVENQTKEHEKILAEREKLVKREFMLQQRARSINEFTEHFQRNPALWVKADPIEMLKEDKQFWEAINEDWSEDQLDLKYGELEFTFDRSVAQKLFGVKLEGGEQQTLQIEDFMID